MTDIQTTELPQKELEEKNKRGRKPLSDEERKLHKIIYNEKAKEYYRTIYGPNRDRTKKVLCACGEEVPETNASRHRKSKKCIDKCRQFNQLNIADN